MSQSTETAATPKLFTSLSESVGIAIYSHDVGSRLNEAMSQRPPDTAGRSRHDSRIAGEVVPSAV